MRSRIAFYATAASLIALPLLTACVAPTFTPRKGNPAVIQLQVVRNTDAGKPGAYKVQKTGRLVCTAPKPQGCIVVPERETATVTFRLGSSPSWRLTRFTLCRQSGADPCQLSLPERADFAFTVNGTGIPAYPDENGQVDLTLLDANLQQFVMHDNNIVEQSYDYTIEACNASGECTNLDPPLENEGLQ